MNHTPIGRSTHAEGTAGAHVSYISRDGAHATIGAFGIPANTNDAQAYLNEQELKDRKNARVADKIMVALPRELTPEQRFELMESYAKQVTQGRGQYIFAIHQTGKDEHNPHGHLLIRDRDYETSDYVMRFSDSPSAWKKRGMEGEKSTDYLRILWEREANQALERAGHEVTIDRRSLEVQRDEALQQGDIKRAQELDRRAQIHIGVKAQRLAEKGIRPESTGNYQKIDNGRTRAEYNAEIIDLNIEKKIRSRDHTIRTWGLFEKEQATKDRELEKQHRQARNRLETQEKETHAHYRIQLKRLGQYRNQYAQTQVKRKEEAQQRAFKTLQTQQTRETEELRQQQGRIFARVTAFLDFTGKTAEKQKQAMSEQTQRHQTEVETHHKTTQDQIEKTRETALKQYETQITDTFSQRNNALERLEQSKEQEETRINTQLQQRAAEREHVRAAVEQVIKDRERQAKAQPRKAVSRALEQDNQPQHEEFMTRKQNHTKELQPDKHSPDKAPRLEKHWEHAQDCSAYNRYALSKDDRGKETLHTIPARETLTQRMERMGEKQEHIDHEKAVAARFAEHRKEIDRKVQAVKSQIRTPAHEKQERGVDITKENIYENKPSVTQDNTQSLSRLTIDKGQMQQGTQTIEHPAHELSHMISDKENNGRTSLERWQDRGFTKLAEQHGQEANARGVKVSDITAEQAHNARYSDTHLQTTPEPQAHTQSRAAEIQAELQATRSGQGQQQSQDRGMSTPEPQAQVQDRAAQIQSELESARSGQSQEQSYDRGMEVG